MHITVHCPSCRGRYQVDPGLRGMRMRCPNQVCREIFEVPSAEESPPRAEIDPAELAAARGESPFQEIRETSKPAKTQMVGSVGDVVPILDAEVVEETLPEGTPAETFAVQDKAAIRSAEVVHEVKPSKERQVPSWHMPPPIRNPKAGAAHPELDAEFTSTPANAPADADEAHGRTDFQAVREDPLAEAPPSWEYPPPIRRGGGSESGQAVEIHESDERSPEDREKLRKPRATGSGQRAIWIILGMVLFAGLIIGGVAVYGLNRAFNKEQNLYSQALKDYNDDKFAAARGKFESLTQQFPKSKYLPTYQFFGDLSDCREQIYSLSPAPREARARLTRFLSENKTNDLLKVSERQSDINRSLRKLGLLMATLAAEERDAAFLEDAKKTYEESKQYTNAAPHPGEDSEFQTLVVKTEASIANFKKKQELIDLGNRLIAEGKPTPEIIDDYRKKVDREGFGQDPDIHSKIHELEKLVRQQVRYVAHQGGARPPLPAEAIEPSLLVTPLVSGTAPRNREARRIVLALVRGVLYALDQKNGNVQWATRVGIDTSALPVRLPATPISPELFLVLSAERNMIMALEAQTGNLYWQHPLSAPCLGRPVVVGRRVYVPTHDGKVHEIETVQGNSLGHFELGQPLTVGGVWQEGTDLIYVPGDSDNLYVLDTALTQPANQPPRAKQCVAILNTGHPSGSLRSAPIIVDRIDPFAKNAVNQATSPSYLILSQADGLDYMKLRVYELPITNGDAQPILKPEPRVRGWSWFQPYYDSEKLAFVTDVGILGLFGINQVRNEDPQLFRMLPEEALPTEATSRLGRAQVVHALENLYWVLANGELKMLQFDQFSQKVFPQWGPLQLGSPLHDSQLDDSGKVLFIVTQDFGRQICLATSVDAETGTILWQRQLGVDCVGDPINLQGQVVLLDRGGGLFRFEGGKSPRLTGREWLISDSKLADPVPATSLATYLLPAGDGATLYELATAAGSTQLAIRIYRAPVSGGAEELEKKEVKLPAALAGTPAVSPRGILLPLVDGTIQQLGLPVGGGMGMSGPNWRSSRADDGARGHVVALSADEFLTTDGSRGITHWNWPMNGAFGTIPPTPVPTAEMPARIVACPVLLPRNNANAEMRVCVTDADDNIVLLRGPELKRDLIWHMQGKITTAPFVRGDHIGCIVDRHQLVWLSPTDQKPVWQYTMPGDGLVGEPQMIGNMLVVADVSGHFLGLDPNTGKPVGPVYGLKARAAPVATPVAFGPEDAFVPLTDGTIFLLDLKLLSGQP